MKLWTDLQFKILLGGCRLIGLLPAWVLYGGFGRFLEFVLHRVVRYRLCVVRQNLANSFPEKSERELSIIEKEFYENLSEIFVDTIRLASISRKDIIRRMTYRNIEQHEQRLKDKSWIAAMSHYGSWELTINYICHTDHRLFAVYRPLHSEAFDKFYRYARSRFGTEPVAMNDIYRTVVKCKAAKESITIAMIADQTPPRHEIKRWYNFLGQDTPFFSGFEKMAIKFGMPVYFTYIRKVAPHHYEADFEEIYNGVDHLEEHEITDRYVKRLEEMIRETPHLWMWSHRRWKHKRADIEAWRREQADNK